MDEVDLYNEIVRENPLTFFLLLLFVEEDCERILKLIL